LGTFHVQTKTGHSFQVPKLTNSNPDLNLAFLRFTFIYYSISFLKGFEVGIVSADKSRE
jgi:hypothetical protein